ncbi:hypothetical protein D554_3228 [Bordetella holmesii 30539]|uniref:N-acetyltransferase YedL n=1 Tax=Bordetella holmesii 1058 TaxID=1247648 RepID=A0ABN0RXE2_9BORD|nr:hypothetical protein D560_3328 [Bordetella holmesii ATCC 51541]AIT27940.1 hypothetical protein D558_3299 [Bordetella holmesii 44057]EWM40717.1 hypothetical protein D555_3361 [Bordetella holmesii 35009]EWM44151.1 hypothetical protein D556_3296 [Bordetella holmesii 41130]EWM44614.1 hypothetical protein D557_2602 [Bordetella holmesii 70147]EXF87952.1 hypothetical protein D554_3228 [Bordetella holmesii 30539]EXX93952.1 hypothetical protein D559_1360 [Bordetella holmesii 1058]
MSMYLRAIGARSAFGMPRIFRPNSTFSYTVRQGKSAYC